MWHPTFSLFLGFICISSGPGARAQLFEDPTLTYKDMTFEWDVRHRGGLEMGRCVKHLMNCWEVIRPDLVCTIRWQMMESVCMLMRNPRCHDLRPWGFGGYESDFRMSVEECYDPRGNTMT